MIIDPRGFDKFQDWADQMSYLIQAGESQFLIFNEQIGDTWQDWAMSVVGAQDALGQDAPNPFDYAEDDWREWAMQLFLTQDLVG